MNSSRSRRGLRVVAVLTLGLGLVTGGLLATPAQAGKVKPDFFGMHDGRIAGGGFPTTPTGAIRLWDSGTTWRDIERPDGTFDFTRLDRAVETARARGAKPMIVLGQTPMVHATDPTAEGAYGAGATSMPRLPAWERYVGAVAREYGTQVEYQVWNEPNVINYWTGTHAEMAKLTETASKVIKREAGSRATVVAPAFPLRLEGQRQWFDTYWAQRVNGTPVSKFVDVVAVNLYPMASQAPEASMKLLQQARKILKRRDVRKPLWNTEINYGLLGGPAATPIPDSLQAAYVARTHALNAAAGIKRVYWYRWDISDIANTHLSESDRRTLTPAGRAYVTVHGWLNGTKVGNCKKARRGKQKGLYTCTARKGKREVRRIYWKPSGGKEKVRTHRTTKSWSTVNGRVKKTKRRVTLKIGSSPVMVASKK